MTKITKKAIKDLLKPISRTLHYSHDTPEDVTIGELKIIGRRLYNSPGCVGPVWNADYSAFHNKQKMMGGNMDQMVDNIYRAINNPEWFKEHCQRLWGDRLNPS